MDPSKDKSRMKEQDPHDHDHGHIGAGATQGPLPGMIVSRGGGLESFEPLAEPNWVSAGEADNMLDEDFVLGLSVGESNFALPWWVMKNHHVANLRFPQTNLMVALCENCSSGAAFNPVVKGNHLSFRVAGLFNGTFFIKDLETGSYWAPFTGTGSKVVPR